MSESTAAAVHDRGLVLGGGGIAGIAWEIGLLAGLAEHGVDVGSADVVVGTSAGSVVGATVRFGAIVPAFAMQRMPTDQQDAAMEAFNADAFMAALTSAVQNSSSDEDARRRLGEFARSVPLIPDAERLAPIVSILPSTQWPDAELRVTAVDATTGRFRVFDSSSGIELARAIAASCSVPGVWPPVPIDGLPFMDGGMRSGTNADVARDCSRVLIIACTEEQPTSGLGMTLPQAVDLLSESSDVLVISADADSLTAFSTNPLSMQSRTGSAEAGYRQATAVAEQVAAFWN